MNQNLCEYLSSDPSLLSCSKNGSISVQNQQVGAFRYGSLREEFGPQILPGDLPVPDGTQDSFRV